MPKQNSHPVVKHRARLGLGQSATAHAATMARSALTAIEEGRTRNPSPATLKELEFVFGLPVGSLGREIDDWFATRTISEQLTNGARATLALRPNQLGDFETFQNWRYRIAPSPTAFASLIGVNRALVAQYEQGIRENGMSVQLMHHIQEALGVSHEYTVALANLEPS